MRILTTTLRLPALFILVTLGAGLTSAPASAAFCGVADDTGPLVKQTVAAYPSASHSNHAINAKSVRVVDVNGTYAYSVAVDGSTHTTFYWEKPTGTWQLTATNRPPSAWPEMVRDFFKSDSESPSSCSI